MYKLTVGGCLIGLMAISITIDSSYSLSYEAKEPNRMPFLNLVFGLYDLNLHLTRNVHSSDLHENLEVLKKFVANETEVVNKGIKSTLFKPTESDILRAARLFSRLLEVASDQTTEARCNQQTLVDLEDLFRAHNPQLHYPHIPPGFNQKGLERVDGLMIDNLPSILTSCEQYYEETYGRKWLKLKPKWRREIEEALSEDVMNRMSEMRHDFRILTTRLAKRIDLQNYKAALESRDDDHDKFIKYYQQFYKKHLVQPCEAFRKQTEDLMRQVRGIDDNCKRFGFPINHLREFSVGQTRWRTCILIGRFSSQYSREDAQDIQQDYAMDVNLNQVDLDDKLPRQVPGPRLY